MKSVLGNPSQTLQLKLKPCKTTAVHKLQPHDPTNGVKFCNWVLSLFTMVKLTITLK